ncbi:homoserine O-acetyltransferase [Coemansia asiatica]|uniref:Homoserine O-acetyltransferase n=1 Tax=Coemansia asiatica TaxID=1052880 RepID=A0A9W7XQI4_9FUNG|nr:homoserine O-acetyltransferase [Coemansia asiatica]
MARDSIEPYSVMFLRTVAFRPALRLATANKTAAQAVLKSTSLKCLAFSTTTAGRSGNPPMSFPCIDRLETRQRDLSNGPEPTYEKVVTGYKVYRHNSPYALDHGGILKKFDLAYETWGTLNADRSNAILIHTGLSGSSHAHSHPENQKPGWWEKFIGSGKAIDTDKFFVICTNVLGGCYGSTGPGSIDPETNARYATTFPLLSVNDMVRAQFLLLDSLKIDKLYASVGASMGGMQALCAAALHSERVGRTISISACARSHPYSIALRFAQRQALMSDPNFNRGFYYDGVLPHVGMKLARSIATVTYRSGPEWELRFGRRRRAPDQPPMLCADFLIETYLDHQSESFCLNYDANSLLYVSKAMDMFDISHSVTKKLHAQREKTENILRSNDNAYAAAGASNTVCMNVNESPQSATGSSEMESNEQIVEDLVAGVKNAMQPTLVLGVQSDILFPVTQQKEIANILRKAGNKNVTYYELDAMYGHDTFLIDLVNVGAAIKGHLENSV